MTSGKRQTQPGLESVQGISKTIHANQKEMLGPPGCTYTSVSESVDVSTHQFVDIAICQIMRNQGWKQSTAVENVAHSNIKQRMDVAIHALYGALKLRHTLYKSADVNQPMLIGVHLSPDSTA